MISFVSLNVIFLFCYLPSDNVELILQGIDSRHDSESQDNDQPDYDSVASDEDPVLEATCGDSSNERRTKAGVPVLRLHRHLQGGE